jgi:transcriptional regulator with XRE-family HTH domain/tetratricopeptide (TPR) repeat protein
VPGRRGSTWDPIRLPDEVWAKHEEQLRARDVGALFRLARRYAGASQHRIATATGVPQSRVSELMNDRGGPVNSIDVLLRIADGLNLPDPARKLLGLASRPVAETDTSRQAPAGERAGAFPDRRRSQADWPYELEAMHSTDGPGGQGPSIVGTRPAAPSASCELVALSGGSGLLPMDRRSLLMGVAGGAAAVLGGQGRGLADARQLAPEIADRLVEMRAMLVRLDSMMGPGRLVATVSEQLANVRELLPLARGALRPRMFEVGSLFAELMGWLQDDIGNRAVGMAWTVQAWEWAEASGNDSLAAYILMRRAQQAVGTADSTLAVGLAIAAQRRSSGSAAIRAAAAQQEALGHAQQGDELEALEALDRALELVTDPQEPPGTFELASWCTPAYVHTQRGAAWMRMGRCTQAVAAFDEALAAWPPEYRRERGLHLARKAHALAADEIVDDAVHTGTISLQIAEETGSRRTLDELAQTVSALRTAADNAAVMEFGKAVESAALEGTTR